MADAQDAFVPLCKVTDVPKGEGKHFRPSTGRWRNKAMAVFEENGHFHALNFICPHQGGPISAGPIKDGVVECPWHAWRFHADTGLSTEADGDCLTVYETKVEGDTLYVGGIKRPPTWHS
ncbi:MAG: Rieske (2Fe-2S) protein [Chloroflexota bacterium]